MTQQHDYDAIARELRARGYNLTIPGVGTPAHAMPHKPDFTQWSDEALRTLDYDTFQRAFGEICDAADRRGI